MDYKGRVKVDHLLDSKWLEQRIRTETEATAARARATAPVESGALKRSISTHVEHHSGIKRDRVVGVVTASVVRDGKRPYNYAAGKEFGNSQTRGEFYLRRSLPG